MNKNQYMSILFSRYLFCQDEKTKKIMKSKAYKDLEELKETHYEKYRELDDKLEEMLPRASRPGMRYDKLFRSDMLQRQKKIQEFSEEWDEMSLIYDVDKREKAKIALLKKYKLYK